MTFYILLLLFASFCGYQYDKTKSQLFVFIIFITLTLMAGFRDVSVGTDSWNYYFQFEEKYTFEQLDIFANLTHEAGFDILLWLSQQLYDNYAVLFLVVGIAVYSCTLITIGKLTESMCISMFVYIALGMVAFCYNGERQGIAIAVYTMSIPYIIKGDFKRYCMVVLTAALFHKTCIVTIPMYFLFRRPFNSQTIMLLVCSSVILTLLLPSLLAFASTLESRYQGYLEESQSGGELLAFAYVVMALFFVNIRKYIDNEKLFKYDIFLIMFLSGSTIFLLVILTGVYIEVCRFATYFHISALFLWPMILKNKSYKCPDYIESTFILGHLVFMVVYYTRMAALCPYAFNHSLFD